MKLHYSPKKNPRVIVIQKIYSKTFNKEEKITFEKHRFKKDFLKLTNNLFSKLIDNHKYIPLEIEIATFTSWK